MPSAAQVLKDLPKKTLRIEWCGMTPGQLSLYRENEASSRRALKTLADDVSNKKEAKKGRKRTRDDLEIDMGPVKGDKKTSESGTGVLMNLRKAANHPLLFRTNYTDAKLKVLARDYMKEPDHMDRDFQMLIEDMEVRPYLLHSSSQWRRCLIMLRSTFSRS